MIIRQLTAPIVSSQRMITTYLERSNDQVVADTQSFFHDLLAFLVTQRHTRALLSLEHSLDCQKAPIPDVR